ncbi:MAG: bifunctional oligoribonuclease/PAP phosphatase NrnA [Sandaracinaceae bacterium]
MSEAAVVALVREGSRFLVTCHRRPDADALGSALGLAAILRTLGKEAQVYSVDPAPRTMRYLDGLEEVRAKPSGEFDACFVMDAASEALVPPLPESLSGPVVIVDHHAAHDGYGDVVLRDVNACATAIVTLRLMHALGVERVPPTAARPLYAALVSDTGGFRYASTDAEAFRFAADLIEAGAEPWPAAYHLFEAWSHERMRLLSKVLDAYTFHLDGRLAVLRVTRQMMASVGADDEMVEGMVNWGRTLQGVEVSLLLWEMNAEGGPETKISLRASGAVDVSQVALALSGGGHRAAAGASVADTLEATEVRCMALLRALLTEGG